MLVESISGGALDNPDSITVGPDDALYMCEDGGGEQFVVGVDDDGNLFKFAATTLLRVNSAAPVFRTTAG
ncbi:MAG: DUF839 domain-containing protein [Candidatus Manganitrophus sp.]|nr:MAG: DUF839 domain-containing protein [Candidatus Manganitrophus sp.]